MIPRQAPSFSQAMQIHSINAENSILQNDGQDSFFRFLYVQDGNGWLCSKTGRQPVHENYLIWLCPDENWAVRLNSGAQGYHFVLQNALQKFLDYDPQLIYQPQFLQMTSASGTMPIDTETTGLFNTLLKTVRTEMDGSCLFGHEILQRYFKIFILHLLRKLEYINQTKVDDAQTDIVQRFQGLLEKNFTAKKQVSDYAAEMFLSPNYLNATIKRLTGHPVSYHIKQRIVLEAKRRGAYTDMCMKQVAYELGFEDIPHFSKYFKSVTGMNFTDFKQEKFLLPMAG